MWSDANHVHLWQKKKKNENPCLKVRKQPNLGFMVSENLFSYKKFGWS